MKLWAKDKYCDEKTSHTESKKHYREIMRWAQQPEGTRVWCKRKSDKRWLLQKAPSWLPFNQYIVDDRDAIERMNITEECNKKEQ